MPDHRLVQVRHALLATALVLAAAIGLLWFWNVAAHDLFGAPRAQFRHALALAVALLLGGVAHPVRQRPADRRSVDRGMTVPCR